MDCEYSGTPISIPVTPAGLSAIKQDCRAMVLRVLDAILRRSERDPEYPFIDTKRDLLAGRDFSDDDPLRGRETVYGWIQGRGMEALALHALWIEHQADLDQDLRIELIQRIGTQLDRTTEAMQTIRQRHGGRLPFMMTRDGQRLQVTSDGSIQQKSLPADRPTSFTDLFFAKGLAATGSWLRRDQWLEDARGLFDEVIGDIRSGEFRSDQQPLDPNNPVQPVPGRFSQGPWMIAIGGCSLLLRITGDSYYCDLGVECLDHILSKHAILSGNASVGQRYDVWEFVDQAGQPYWEGQQLRTDPGHVTELVGLALKFLRTADSVKLAPNHAAELQEVLAHILRQSFITGYSPAGLGIVKGVDLVTRQVMHPAMPWWSLPETMRAAMEVARLRDPDQRGLWLDIAGQCFNALVRHYIRPAENLMAIQTLGPDGQPIDSIPATPDIDPAYHTGLSLLDVLDYLKA